MRGSRALVGQIVTVKVAANGAVPLIGGAQQALEHARRQAGNKGFEAMSCVINGGILRDVIVGLFGKVPNAALPMGGKWSEVIDEGPTTTKIEYTLDRADAAAVEIGVAGTIGASVPSERVQRC